MTSYYFLNLAGCRLSDEKMEQVPLPRAELLTHITLKTLQAGSILGTAMVGPVVSAAKGKRDLESIQQSSYQYGRKGAIMGLVLGPALFLMVSRGMSYDGAWDRSYRLRYNRNQVFADRMSILGAAVGAGAAHYLGEELGRGALFGFAGGCLLSGVINTVM